VKIHFAALVMVALGAASNMMADGIIAAPSGTQDYTYDLSLPSITIGDVATENDSALFDVEFSWLGPEMYNAGPNTSCPLGCPVDGTTPGSPAAGFSLAGFTFTASTGEDCATAEPADGCGEVIVNFQDAASDQITYTLIEPDVFWSTSGADTFASGDGIGTGASWVYVPSGTSELPDPGCTLCSVTTTATAAAPEPGTWLLLAGGLGAAFFKARGRRSAAARTLR
jgi:hypothetical protein